MGILRKTPIAQPSAFDALLNQTTVPNSDAKKKREIIPVIKLNEINTKHLKEFLNNKKTMKESEGQMRLAEQPILSVCIERMEADGLEDVLASTYEVIGSDGTKTKFISVDKWSVSQETENIAALKEVLGDKFDEEIVKTPTVTMKAEVFEDKVLQKELMTIMGDKFVKFFETKVKYSTKAGFNDRIFKIAKNKAKLAEIKSLMPQSKPFFK